MKRTPKYRVQLGKFSFWYPDESILPTLFTKKYVQNRHNRDRLRYLVIGPKKEFTSHFTIALVLTSEMVAQVIISVFRRYLGKSKWNFSLARRTKQEWRCKSRRVRTHHSTPRVAVRRLGRIIQRIFLPNQEAALVEPFGKSVPRGFFRLTCKHTTLHFFARFISSRPN